MYNVWYRFLCVPGSQPRGDIRLICFAHVFSLVLSNWVTVVVGAGQHLYILEQLFDFIFRCVYNNTCICSASYHGYCVSTSMYVNGPVPFLVVSLLLGLVVPLWKTSAPC